jgi:hypothetical protein
MRSAQNKHGPQVAARVTFISGEGGIRTRGTVTRTQHFQCCTIDHSATSPCVPTDTPKRTRVHPFDKHRSRTEE